MKTSPDIALAERYHLRGNVFRASSKNHTGESLPNDAYQHEFRFPSGACLKVDYSEPLTPSDAAILCVILHLCSKSRRLKSIPPRPVDELDTQLREALELKHDAQHELCLALPTTTKDIALGSGLKLHGGIDDIIIDSLRRFQQVSLKLEHQLADEDGIKHRVIEEFNIMSHTVINNTKGKPTEIYICINPVLTRTVKNPRHFTRISLEILRRLNPTEKLLYIMLCNAIDEGKVRLLTTDKLREIVYGKLCDGVEDKMKKDTIIKQRQRAKKFTIDMINKIPGWEAEVSSQGLEISRPRDAPPKTNSQSDDASPPKRARRKRLNAPQQR